VEKIQFLARVKSDECVKGLSTFRVIWLESYSLQH